MKVIIESFKIFWEKDKFILIILIPIIFITAFLTTYQAEVGQAIFSALNSTSSEKIIIENAPEPSISIEYGKFIYNHIKEAGSIEKTLSFLLQIGSLKILIFIGIIALLFYIIYELFLYFKEFGIYYLGNSLTVHLQDKLFSKLLTIPSLYYKNEGKTGDIISRLLNDVTRIRQSISVIFETVFFAPVLLIIAIYNLINKNLYFSIILLVLGTAGVLVINLVSKLLKKFVIETQKKIGETSEYINKTIYGIDVIRIFNKEEEEKKNFKSILKKLKKALIKQVAMTVSEKPLVELLGAIIAISIVLTGSFMISQGKLDLNEIIGFVVYMVVIFPHIQKVSKVIYKIREAEGAFVRINEVFDTEEESNHFGNKQLNNFKGNIHFKNLSFSYDKSLDPNIKEIEYSLNNIDLNIKQGEFIALVGPSGAGKSTLINLIPALLYPTSGQILFDGNSYQNYKLEQIRKYISYVPQETILFPDTIRNNIAYGNPNVRNEEIEDFAKMSNAHDFIKSLPQGYDTILGERGSKVSGGQKQRIAIARALIKDPKVLLLDEATSALDSESESQIQEAILKIAHKQTMVVIAHRLSTILNADRIIVMNQGKIIDQGSHSELLEKSEMYKKLYYSQFANGE